MIPLMILAHISGTAQKRQVAGIDLVTGLEFKAGKWPAGAHPAQGPAARRRIGRPGGGGRVRPARR